MTIKTLLRLKIDTTLENLRKNRMEGYFVKDRTELLALLEQLIPDGSRVGFGGSTTLEQLGVIQTLRDRPVSLIDLFQEGVSPAQRKSLLRECFTADCLLTSSNAITEQGELYNIDGNGNRVAAMIYGPESVIVVAGVNKIVPSLEDAQKRLEQIAAPANAIRLNKDAPCAKLGHCVHCRAPQRICSFYVLTGWQQNKGRIKVVLVDDCLGF